MVPLRKLPQDRQRAETLLERHSVPASQRGQIRQPGLDVTVDLSISCPSVAG